MAGETGLAEDLRTGLDDNMEKPEQIKLKLVLAEKREKLDELFHGKPIRQHIVEFGALMGTIITLVAIYQVYKNSNETLGMSLAAISIALYAVSKKTPKIIFPIWDKWMAFAEKLSVVMTYLLLGILWMFMINPISFIVKFLRIKVMDTTYKLPVESYWENRSENANDFALLKRQF